MKIFLKRLFAFLGIFLFINILFLSFNYYIVNRALFKLPADKHILILGDSHTTRGLNDKLLPGCINFSSNGEGYIYGYLKLQKFLAANKQIDTVLLSFNYNSLAKNKDRWTTGTEFIDERISHYSAFFGSDEYKIFIKSSDFYESLLKMPFLNKKIFITALKGRLNYKNLHMGGFEASHENKIDAAMQLLEKGEQRDASGYSEYQLTYLKKIIETCKHYNRQLVFVNTPIYQKALPYYDTARYYAFYRQKMSNIPLIDLANLNLKPSDFRDAEHVNSFGAKILSDSLNTILKNKKVALIHN